MRQTAFASQHLWFTTTLACLLLFVFTPFTTSAQTTYGPEKGDWGVQAFFMPFENLNTWSNSNSLQDVYQQYYITNQLSEHLGWRAGVEFSVYGGNSESTLDEYANGVLDTTIVNELDTQSWQFGLHWNLMWRSNPERSVQFYAGTGPFFGMYRYTEDVPFTGSYTDLLPERTITLLALSGAIGAEWFFTDHMALSAEYALMGGMEWDNTTTERFSNGTLDSRTEDETTHWQIETGYVKVGLRYIF